jgi:hypothetical protein
MTNDEALWRKLRKLAVSILLSAPKVRLLQLRKAMLVQSVGLQIPTYIPIIHEELDTLMDRWSQAKGKPIEVRHDLHAAIITAIARLATGRSKLP